MFVYQRVSNRENEIYINPRCSMYGIWTCNCVIYKVNVGQYTIHGAYGYGIYIRPLWDYYGHSRTLIYGGTLVPYVLPYFLEVCKIFQQ